MPILLAEVCVAYLKLKHISNCKNLGGGEYCILNFLRKTMIPPHPYHSYLTHTWWRRWNHTFCKVSVTNPTGFWSLLAISHCKPLSVTPPAQPLNKKEIFINLTCYSFRFLRNCIYEMSCISLFNFCSIFSGCMEHRAYFIASVC